MMNISVLGFGLAIIKRFRTMGCNIMFDVLAFDPDF